MKVLIVHCSKLFAEGKLFEGLNCSLQVTQLVSLNNKFSTLQYAILNPDAASYFQLDVTTNPGVVRLETVRNNLYEPNNPQRRNKWEVRSSEVGETRSRDHVCI